MLPARAPAVVFAVVLALTLTSGCAPLRGATGKRTAEVKSTKDLAACEKMCEVAGDSENEGAIDRCKKRCAD